MIFRQTTHDDLGCASYLIGEEKAGGGRRRRSTLRDRRVSRPRPLDEKEWGTGHIPGSMFTPWHDISEVPPGLDPRKPVAVICGSGQRAGTAASLLSCFGAEQ
jgi:hypothetical protein